MALPKYVQKANQIIDLLAEQQGQTWDKTQKELGEQLGWPLPELSALLKTLSENGKIERGANIPGHRGRTTSIVLVDGTHLEAPVRRLAKQQTTQKVAEETINLEVLNLQEVLDQLLLLQIVEN